MFRSVLGKILVTKATNTHTHTHTHTHSIAILVTGAKLEQDERK